MSKGASPKTPINPREKLGHYYNLEEELPVDILDKINPNQSSHDPYSVRDGSADIAAVKDVFDNKRMSLLDKEAIAAKMLTGDHQFAQDSHASTNDSHKRNRRGMNRMEDKYARLNRHKMPKPQFLTLISSSASIPEMNPKTVYRNKIDQIRKAPPNIKPIVSKSHGSTEIFKYTYENERTTVYKNLQTAEAKKIHMQQSVADMKNVTAQIMHNKSAGGAREQKARDVHSEIHKFRQMIRGHLVKKYGSNLDIGHVMKCIDDTMLYHFLSEYNGYEMTIDAILTKIANSVGSSPAEPTFELDLNTLNLNKDYGTRRKFTHTDMTQAERMKPAAQTNLSHHNLSVKMTDMNIYYPPRRFSFDRKQKCSVQAMGSGFFNHANDGLSMPSKSTTLPYLPQYSSLDGHDWPMSLMEDIDDYKKTKTRSPSRPSTQNVTIPVQPSIEEAPLTEDIIDTISVMNQQLILEKILPSLEPERVITDKQLKQLGMHEKKFEEIMQEIEAGKKPSINFNNQHSFFLTADTNLGTLYPSKDKFTPNKDPALSDPPPCAQDMRGGVGQSPQTAANGTTESPFPSRPSSPGVENFLELTKKPALTDYAADDISRENTLQISEGNAQRGKKPLPENGFRLAVGHIKSGGQNHSGSSGTLVGSGSLAPGNMQIQGIMPSLSFGSPEERQEMMLGMSMLQRNRMETLNNQMNSQMNTHPDGRPMTRQEIELASDEPDFEIKGGPRAIKSRNRPRDSPKSPYSSFYEKSTVQNAGVAAGAGLRMFNKPPAHRITRDGRYKVGLASSTKNDPAYDPLADNYMHTRPFLPMA